MDNPNNQQNDGLLRDLDALGESLRDSSPEFAFAFGWERQGIRLSFLDFVSTALQPSVAPNQVESSWGLDQITSPPGPVGAPEIEKLLSQAKMCVRAPLTPIVAVLGLLNAGKSSMVSTFLSEENRQRILIGASNNQGTHRFVLWLPDAWKRDTTIWAYIQQRLTSVFGCESESLSTDPVVANQQYNDLSTRKTLDASGNPRELPTIEIPLVATDTELDRWGIALMDCPDVQTGLLPNGPSSASDKTAPTRDQLFHEQSQSVADSRLKVLTSASPLCSAFIVVLPANAMHDHTVSRLLRMVNDRMPEVQRILAVNRVPRRYLASEIQAEINSLYGGENITRKYMAYGFDGPLQRERIPNPPAGFAHPVNYSLPLFFRIDARPPIQPPQTVPHDEWLLNISSQLDRKSLFDDLLKSTKQNLGSQLKKLILHAKNESLNSQATTRKLWQTVANACLDFSTETGGEPHNGEQIRLQASRQVVKQISESLKKTAPWWARPSIWTTWIAETGKASASKWVQLPSWFSGRTEAISRWIRARWSSGQSGKIVTADVLSSCLQNHDTYGALRLDESDAQQKKLLKACQSAIDRFQNESATSLNDGELDELTTRMWREMPLSKRLVTGLAPAGIFFAPIVAVTMVPFDFGGSAVMVFASLKELLFAGVAGVGLVIASSDHMPKIAESEVAWQQMGDLFAVLCDELGLARPLPASTPSVLTGTNYRPIATSQIPVKNPDISQQCAPVGYQINARSLSKIEKTIDQILGI